VKHFGKTHFGWFPPGSLYGHIKQKYLTLRGKTNPLRCMVWPSLKLAEMREAIGSSSCLKQAED